MLFIFITIYVYICLMFHRFAFACFVQDHAFWQNTNGEHKTIFTNFIIHIHSMLNYYVFVTISLFPHFYICKHDESDDVAYIETQK
jgi:hypothetical protein